jgi:hypothetical protein
MRITECYFAESSSAMETDWLHNVPRNNIQHCVNDETKMVETPETRAALRDTLHCFLDFGFAVAFAQSRCSQANKTKQYSG